MYKHCLAFLGMALLLGACAGTSTSVNQKHEGTSVYTQRGMWSEKGLHLATNYSIGYHIPINTRVEVRDTSGKEIVIYIPELDEQVRVINMPQYTKLDMAELFDRYFGSTPVNLGRFDADTRRAIESGKVNRGMSKEAVLLARGYPPVHVTPSTDLNSWTYWRNRFARQIVHFENGRVSEIEK